MSTEAKLVLSSISGIITGILVSTGHLDATSAGGFQQDIETIGGLAISIISMGYLLEHLLVKLKSEIKLKNPMPTSVTVTTPTTTIETKEPAPEVPVEVTV